MDILVSKQRGLHFKGNIGKTSIDNGKDRNDRLQEDPDSLDNVGMVESTSQDIYSRYALVVCTP